MAEANTLTRLKLVEEDKLPFFMLHHGCTLTPDFYRNSQSRSLKTVSDLVKYQALGDELIQWEQGT